MTEPLPNPSAIDLRASIDLVIDQLATTCAGNTEVPNLDPYLNRIMNAVGNYADAIIAIAKEHRAVTVADMRSGPSLTYVHTDGETMTAVDHAAVTSNPRERAISRALITEALRLLDTTEAPPATYRPLVICACGHPAIEHTQEADGCAHCACRQCCTLRPGTTDYCVADSQHTGDHTGRSKNTWTNR